MPSRLDLEQQRVRNLQLPGSSQILPLKEAFSSPGLSPTSSIGKASSSEKGFPSPLRPQLEPPQETASSKHYMWNLLQIHAEFENLMKKLTGLFEQQARQIFKEIDLFQEKSQEALREYTEWVKSTETWKGRSAAAECLSSSASFFLGILCLTSGVAALALPGWLLSIGGGIGLGNSVMRATGAWQTVAGWFSESAASRNRLAQQLERGAFIFSLGFGIAGGIAAWGTGAFQYAAEASRDSIKGAVLKIVTTAATVFGMATRFGATHAEKKAADAQARIKKIDTKITHLHFELDQYSTRHSNFSECYSRINKTTGQIVAGAAG